MSALLLILLPAYAALKSRKATAGLRHLAEVRSTSGWQQIPWLALDELHVEQVWEAGRAVPTWASPADSVPTLPALVFAAAPLAKRLPAAWRGRVQLAAPDSFYLGSRPEDGQFFTALLLPVPALPAAAASLSEHASF